MCLLSGWATALAGWTRSEQLTAQVSAKSRRYPSAKAFDPLESFLNVRHACGIAEPDVIVGTEGDTRDSGHFFGIQQPRTKLGGFEACSGNIGKEVKSSFDVDAGNTRYRVKFFPGEGAAFIEFCQPGFQMVLGAS